MRLVRTWLILAAAFSVFRLGLSHLFFGSVQSTGEGWAHLALVPLFQALFEQAKQRLSASRLRAAIGGAARRPLPAALLVGDCALLLLAIVGVEWADPAHGSIGSCYFAGKALLAGAWLVWLAWREKQSTLQSLSLIGVGGFLTGLGLESLLHLLPSSVFYLVATAIASVSLITLFAVSSGNPGLAAAVSLLAPASMIGALSFRISPAIQPGWATAAATLALLGMTFLVFSLPVEAASNRDKEGQRQVGRAGGRQRPDWLFMDFFLRHWLLLFLTMAAIRPAVSYLGFGHIDLRQRVLAEILFVPLCQAFLLCFLRDRIVPWPGGKHLTGWLSSPVILLFLLLDSLLLIAPLLDESWLATLTSDEGLAHSYTGLKAAMGAMLLAGLSRRMAVRFADTIWLWAASGGLAAYALDYFLHWTRPLPAWLFPSASHLSQWSVVYGTMFIIAVLGLLRVGRIVERQRTGAGSLFGLAVAFAFLAALLVVVNFYNVPFLVPPWLGVVKALSFLVVASLWIAILGLWMTRPPRAKER